MYTKSDVWEFSITHSKNNIQVSVYLGFTEQPSEEETVKELVKYISIFERINDEKKINKK